jgi:hypothetical protein
MPITPQPPFPKSKGDTVRSADWNDTVNEVIRLDNAKVNRNGDTIGGALTVNGGITIPDNSLPGTKLLANSTPGAKLQDASIPASKLADNSVPGGKLQENTLQGSKILDDSIRAGKFSYFAWTGSTAIGPNSTASWSFGGAQVGGPTPRSDAFGKITNITFPAGTQPPTFVMSEFVHQLFFFPPSTSNPTGSWGEQLTWKNPTALSVTIFWTIFIINT